MQTKKIDAGTITRTVLLVVALINQILSFFGISPIPLDDDTVTGFITLGFTVGMTIWSWWKNNDITSKARLKSQIAEDLYKDLNE